MRQMVFLMTFIFFFSGCTKDVENHLLVSYRKRPTPGTTIPDKPAKPPLEEEIPKNPDEPKLISGNPKTVVNREDAEKVKIRIQNGIEPQASAFKALIDDANEALKFQPDPPDHMNIIVANLWDMFAILLPNSMTAYSTALAWLYTGDDAYAEKTVEVCMAWAKKGTTFDGQNAGTALVHRFVYMLYAVDIIKGFNGWTIEDRELFEEWWYSNVIRLNLINLRYGGNFMHSAILGTMTAGVAFEDDDLLYEGMGALNTYFEEKNGDPDWRFKNDEYGVWLTGQTDRGSEGVGYTALHLSMVVQALEIARYCGHNWWHRETVNGATIKGAIENLFKWHALREPFPWHDKPDLRPFGENTYELLNYHFPDKTPDINKWLEVKRPVNGLYGDPYSTLNRGGLLR